MSKTETPKDLNETLVRKLAEILNDTGLTEIEYGADDWHIRVSKSPAPVTAFAAGPAFGPAAAPSAAPAAAAEAGAKDSLASHPGVVVSPMVGMAYTMPEPGAAPFVQVGDTVKPGDTLLLIEAMKVFNPIKASRAGKVTRILVGNGAPVEFGEPLMIIE